MARLIRMDQTGHTTLAEWEAEDAAGYAKASDRLAEELAQGYFAVATTPQGGAEQVTHLPLDAATVILRRPIAGG
jgi:hypothetical protein